jgi:hypothetical protein
MPEEEVERWPAAAKKGDNPQATEKPLLLPWRLLAHHKGFPLWHKVLIILAKNTKFTNSIVYFH